MGIEKCDNTLLYIESILLILNEKTDILLSIFVEQIENDFNCISNDVGST